MQAPSGTDSNIWSAFMFSTFVVRIDYMEVKLCKNVGCCTQSHVREFRGWKLTLICIKEWVFVKIFVPPFSLNQHPQHIPMSQKT